MKSVFFNGIIRTGALARRLLWRGRALSLSRRLRLARASSRLPRDGGAGPEQNLGPHREREQAFAFARRTFPGPGGGGQAVRSDARHEEHHCQAGKSERHTLFRGLTEMANSSPTPHLEN